jgi:hypothetical protein
LVARWRSTEWSRTLPAARKAGAAIVGVAFTRVVRVARPEAVAIAVKGQPERRWWSKLKERMASGARPSMPL